MTDLVPLPRPDLPRLFRVRCVELYATTTQTGTTYLRAKLHIVGTRFYLWDNIPTARAEYVCDDLNIDSMYEIMKRPFYVQVRYEARLGHWTVTRYTRYRRRPFDNREVA